MKLQLVPLNIFSEEFRTFSWDTKDTIILYSQIKAIGSYYNYTLGFSDQLNVVVGSTATDVPTCLNSDSELRAIRIDENRRILMFRTLPLSLRQETSGRLKVLQALFIVF